MALMLIWSGNSISRKTKACRQHAQVTFATEALNVLNFFQWWFNGSQYLLNLPVISRSAKLNTDSNTNPVWSHFSKIVLLQLIQWASEEICATDFNIQKHL